MKRDKSQQYGIVRVFLKLTPHIIRCAPWSFAGAQCGMALYGIILGLIASFAIYKAFAKSLDLGFIWPIGAMLAASVFVFIIVFIIDLCFSGSAGAED